MAARIVFDGRAFVPLLILSACGLVVWALRQPWLFLPLAVLGLALHFLVLPRLAQWRSAQLDRTLLLDLQRKRPEEMLQHLQSSLLIRWYAPRWYLAGKKAFVRMSLGQNEEAERCYTEALPEAPEPERSTFLANLSVVQERQGKSAQARLTRQQLQFQHPELVSLLEENAQEDGSPGERPRN